MKTTKLLLATLMISTSLMAQSGITWNAPISINGMSMYGNEHPRITLDRSGDPMVLWGNSSNNNAYFSKWNGASFTTPTAVNTGVPCFTASWAGPDIASHGDTVYVVVKQTPEMTNFAYLYKSFDGGTSFSGPTQVDNFLADSISRFPTVTTNASGNPVVGYMKIDPTFDNARWVVTTSNDFGATFPVDVIGSDWSGGDVCDCCPATMTTNGNTVAIMYRDNNSNIRDMWTGISTDGGNSFNGGFALDSPGWMLMMCPSSGPDGVIIGDTLHSVLMSGFTGDYLVYYSKTSLTSMGNDTVFPVTGLLAGMTTQNYPRIASDGSAVGIVWKQAISGQDQLPLLFTNNILNGFPAQYDTVDLGNITNADIAIYDGNIHVVWEDPGSGTVRYRSGTYNSVLSIEETLDGVLSIYPNPANTNITLQLREKSYGEGIVEIIDLLGKTELQRNVLVEDGKLFMDVSFLKSGNYQLRLLLNGKQFATSFTKI